MILDESKVSELLGDNNEEKSMEHDYNKSSVNILPANPYGNNGGFGSNEALWALLFSHGITDRNRNQTGDVVTASQIQALANSFNTTASEMSNRLNALQISTCEQTGTIKDSVHASSTTNLIGQNTLGEKITNVAFKGDSNTKDIEKTILVDGGTTRSNSDDNANDLKNNQIAGFSSTKDSIYGLSTKTSAEHCDIKGMILDNKYAFSTALCATQNHLSTQAILNQNSTDKKLCEIQCEQTAGFIATNAKIDKVNDAQIIRAQEAYIHKLEHGSTKEENVRIHNEINNNSKNMGSIVDSFKDLSYGIRGMNDRLNVFIGN